MFDYVDMLQGPSRGATDSDDEGGDRAPKQAPDAAGAVPAAETGGAFSLWGMAAALAENVKKSTAEIAARFAGPLAAVLADGSQHVPAG